MWDGDVFRARRLYRWFSGSYILNMWNGYNSSLSNFHRYEKCQKCLKCVCLWVNTEMDLALPAWRSSNSEVSKKKSRLASCLVMLRCLCSSEHKRRWTASVSLVILNLIQLAIIVVYSIVLLDMLLLIYLFNVNWEVIIDYYTDCTLNRLLFSFYFTAGRCCSKLF